MVMLVNDGDNRAASGQLPLHFHLFQLFCYQNLESSSGGFRMDLDMLVPLHMFIVLVLRTLLYKRLCNFPKNYVTS